MPKAHEAIVSQELFERVQTILDKKRPKKPGRWLSTRREYVLSGLLWCKVHNQPYTGHANGVNTYYACAERKRVGKKQAPCPYLKQRAMEQFVLEKLKDRILTKERIREGLEYLAKEAAKNAREDDTELAVVSQEVARVDLELFRIKQAVLDGIKQELFTRDINTRLDKKSSLEKRLVEIQQERERSLKVPKITEPMVLDIWTKVHGLLDTKDPKELKAVVAHFIERIEIELIGEKVLAHIFYLFAPSEQMNVSGKMRPRWASGCHTISGCWALPSAGTVSIGYGMERQVVTFVMV